MGKSTLVLIALAALGIGALIGVSFVGEPESAGEPAAASATTVGASPAADSGGAPVFRFLSPDGVTVEHDDFGQPLPTLEGDNFIARHGVPKSRTVEVTLELDSGIEYKALMQQGDVIGFNWATDGNEVYYDFHGHDEAFGPEFFTRYDEGEGTSRSGSIMAPYAGQHGWFWLNIGDGPTTITLEVYGFFDDVIEIELEGY